MRLVHLVSRVVSTAAVHPLLRMVCSGVPVSKLMSLGLGRATAVIIVGTLSPELADPNNPQSIALQRLIDRCALLPLQRTIGESRVLGCSESGRHAASQQ